MPPVVFKSEISQSEIRHLSYYIIYKPFQVMSQFSAVEGKQVLADYFQVEKDVYPVGRLDYDSEGLLILTNDTKLNGLLLNPTKQHEREYYVQVEGIPEEKSIQQLRTGVAISIDGKKHQTLPCKATLLQQEPLLPARNPPIRFRQNIPTSWLSLALVEGKNRQVRRMTAAVGFPTLRLVRWRMEKITIEGMQPGDMRKLEQKEIYRLLKLK